MPSHNDTQTSVIIFIVIIVTSATSCISIMTRLLMCSRVRRTGLIRSATIPITCWTNAKLNRLRYEECLKECGLTTLETRRLIRDQIEILKILNEYENIDRNMFSHS